MDAFSDITEKDIPSIMKESRRTNVLIRQTSQNYLQALCYWVIKKERLQVNYLPEEFTDAVMHVSLQQYQSSIELISQDLIKTLEMFKEKNKWHVFIESFIMFMQRIKGQCDFSLSYILRDNDYGEDILRENYETDDAYKEAIVPFSGAHFKLDNNSVFESLKSYVLGGPHWTWIQGYECLRDGRGA